MLLALAAAMLCGAGTAAETAPPPDLSGRWVLNEKLSEDAREKMRGARGGPGGGGSRPTGGGRGGYGGRGDLLHRSRMSSAPDESSYFAPRRSHDRRRA